MGPAVPVKRWPPRGGVPYERAPWFDGAQHRYGLLAGRAGQPGVGFYLLASAARLDGDYATALHQYARAAPPLPARTGGTSW